MIDITNDIFPDDTSGDNDTLHWYGDGAMTMTFSPALCDDGNWVN